MTRSRTFLGALLLSIHLVSRADGAEIPTEDDVKALLATGDTARAIEAGRKRAAASPQDADARVLLASALLKKATDDVLGLRPRPDGRPTPIAATDADAVGKELEAAIQIAPARKDLYLGLVELAWTAGHDDELIRQVARAGRAFPGDVRMMAGLLDQASDAFDRGESDLAGRIVETVFDAYPRQADAVLSWASLLVTRGDLARAKSVLQAGAQVTPRHPLIHQSLGDTSCYELDFETAARSYARAAGLDPSNDAHRLAWAAALHVSDQAAARTVAEPVWAEETRKSRTPTIEMNQDPETKARYRVTAAGAMLLRAIMRPPFTATDAYTLARSFWQAGFPAPALAETEIALRKDGVFAEAHVLRAEIFGRLGLGAQALESSRRAEAILDAAEGRTFAVTRDEVLATRAAIEAKLGKSEDALATYRRTSDPARYSYPMALAAERLGRTEEARALLEKTITSGTNPAEIDAARARLAADVYRKKP